MSRAAAQAMRDLSSAIHKEADGFKPGLERNILRALGDAHNEAAERIAERARKAEEALGPGLGMPPPRRKR